MKSPDDLLVENGVPVLGTKLRSFATHPAISLDGLVPPDDFYRFLDAQLDLSFVRDWVRLEYAESGRPSIDPVVFFKTHHTDYPYFISTARSRHGRGH
jgi:hypothetical protein